MSKDRIMEKAAENECRVRIICTDGELFIGDAFSYCSADDEEDGAPSIIIDTNDGGLLGFSGNDIEHIEIIDDEPLSIDDTMEAAVVDGRMVRIECFVRETYIGKAVSYVCAADEDDGISTIGIENDEYDGLS